MMMMCSTILLKAQCDVPTYTFKSTPSFDAFSDFTFVDNDGAFSNGTIIRNELGVNFVSYLDNYGVVGGTDTRIFKILPTPLSDSSWRIEFNVNIIKGKSSGHYIMCLSEGPVIPGTSNTLNQIVLALYREDLNNTLASGTYAKGEYDIDNLGTAIVAYYGNKTGGTTRGSLPINILPTEIGVGKYLKISLERFSKDSLRLSKKSIAGVLLDSSSFKINSNISNLNTIQISSNAYAWNVRSLAANFNDYKIYNYSSISGTIHQGLNSLNNGKVSLKNTCTDSVFNTFTNNLGQFNIANLPSGEYLLKAIPKLNDKFNSTFYPNVQDSTKSVLLTLGGNISGIDLFMEPKSDEIKEYLSSEIIVSPNPFNSELNINIVENYSSSAYFTLFDIYGNILKEINSDLIEILKVDTSKFNNGIYYLKSKIGNNITYLKFVKS